MSHARRHCIEIRLRHARRLNTGIRDSYASHKARDIRQCSASRLSTDIRSDCASRRVDELRSLFARRAGIELRWLDASRLGSDIRHKNASRDIDELRHTIARRILFGTRTDCARAGVGFVSRRRPPPPRERGDRTVGFERERPQLSRMSQGRRDEAGMPEIPPRHAWISTGGEAPETILIYDAGSVDAWIQSDLSYTSEEIR